MTDDLVKRLRAQRLGDIYLGPHTTEKLIDEAADRLERLEACLELRDAFIVSKDLWFEFVDSAALAGEKKDE
jgi:hypothetical protein